MVESFNRVEISRSALRHNLAVCRALAGPDCAIVAMVKADAYGHGMVECARILAEEGVVRFGVAEAVEGVRLRQAGIRGEILVLAGTLPETVGAMAEHDLTPVVTDSSMLAAISRQAEETGREIGVQLKVDAGMGRLGCLAGEMEEAVRTISELPGIALRGILAHFPMADDPESENSARVRERFDAMVWRVRHLLPPDLCLHIANSGGLFYGAGTGLDCVRPGIALYGCPPDGGLHAAGREPTGLRPVMRFVSRVIQVRRVPAGTGLGYGHIFTTRRPTTIAILPVGYEDGYLRSLSNRSCVLIRGQRVPVIGRISMNLTMIDVTGIDGVRPGEEAVLLGRQGDGEITADELAAWMGTISYEVLCLLGNLNRRVFVE
ncbi:MAG TPA: alanine racemase [Desulfobulbus sp.]|nr:alanine racemase [Desulfobulbus sp.]